MANDPKGYYSRLGLAPTATHAEIKMAYRRIVKTVHPDSDVRGDKDPIEFLELNEAYAVLGNGEKRLEYDMSALPRPVPVTVTDGYQADFHSHKIKISPSDAPPYYGPQKRKFKWPLISTALAAAAIACFLALPRLQIDTKYFSPGLIFGDCRDCPSMIVVPAGQFTMGTPLEEGGTPKWSNPAHTVTIGRSIAVARFLVTNNEFAEFVTDTWSQRALDQPWADTDQQTSYSHLLWRGREVLSERGFETHPVVRVSWPGAQAYVQWLSRMSGHRYRLLSEAEWEFAARAGTKTTFFFGDDATNACDFANVPDRAFVQNHLNASGINCTDGYSETSPVGKFKPNSFGLYDMVGNVWEWVEDCWHDGYAGAPTNGAAWIADGICTKRVLRGQSFDIINWAEGVALRSSWDANGRLSTIGFRVARDLN